AADRDGHELAAANLVDRGHALGGGIQFVLPQYRAGGRVAGTKRAVAGGADEQQPARGGDRAAARRLAPGAGHALLLEHPALAVRQVVELLPGVHVVGGQERERRLDRGHPVRLQHEVVRRAVHRDLRARVRHRRPGLRPAVGNQCVERRDFAADHEQPPAFGIDRRAAPAGPAIVTWHRDRATHARWGEQALVARGAQDLADRRLVLFGATLVDVGLGEALARERQGPGRERLGRRGLLAGDVGCRDRPLLDRPDRLAGAAVEREHESVLGGDHYGGNFLSVLANRQELGG